MGADDTYKKINDYLSFMHKHGGFIAERYRYEDKNSDGRTEYLDAFCAAIGGKPEFRNLSSRLIVAIDSLNDDSLTEILLAGFKLHPDFKEPTLIKRQKACATHLGMKYYTVADRATEGIKALAAFLSEEGLSGVEKYDIIRISDVILARYRKKESKKLQEVTESSQQFSEIPSNPPSASDPEPPFEESSYPSIPPGKPLYSRISPLVRDQTLLGRNQSHLCNILLGFPLHRLLEGQKQQIADSVKAFAKEKFSSPLFFEEKGKDDAPTLDDVYTFQNFVTYGLPKESNKERDDLETLIRTFLEEESTNRSDYFRKLGCPTDDLSGLIILANAGMGKSSILAWIAHNCSEMFPICTYEHVYLAKLRDLSNQVCSVDLLTELFREVKGYIKDSIFLLDAFDEFKTNSDDYKRIDFVESLCSQISENGGRLIITSRLNYFEHLNPKRFTHALAIGLCPFTSEQATQWWGKYSNKKPSSFALENLSSIQKKIADTEDRNFYGVPIVLYMIAYSETNIGEYENEYDLYTALFGDNGIRGYGAREGMSRLKSPEYNSYVRFDSVKSGLLFDVLCDIAYRIYLNEKEGSANGCVKRCQAHEIIRNNYPKEYEVFLTNHYSIASYFRGSADGILEFVHRSIFEYYLARWILREYCVRGRREAFEMMRHTSNATNRFLLQAIVAEGIEDVALAGLDLSGADFTGLTVVANLKGTNLSKVILKGGSLEDSEMDTTTIKEGMVKR